MELLPQQEPGAGADEPTATCADPCRGEKRRGSIGGGDTGSDASAPPNRQGALKITQLGILPRPPDQ